MSEHDIEAGLRDHLASLTRRREAVAAVLQGGAHAIQAALRRKRLEAIEAREVQRLDHAAKRDERERAWRSPDVSERGEQRGVSLEAALRHLDALREAEAERRERAAELTKHEREPYRTEAALRAHLASLAQRRAARVALERERRDAALAELQQARSAEGLRHE